MPERSWEVAGASPVTENDVLAALVHVRGREIARRLAPGAPSLPEGFGAELSHHRDVPVLALRGDLDVVSAPAVRQLLGDAADDAGRVVVDLRNVDFIDSMGLGALIAARRRTDAGIAVLIEDDTSTVEKLLRTTRLDRMFPIARTVDACVDELAAGGAPAATR